ncbi:GntR family transcriptional regulator [Kallipyga gabonensis]|uniref:GntR family transcriptional regulator n=1 Tax=Kallipyga gabonensis TaxID=1686287 RepID=UPI0006B51C8C|nr:GntR family transcriptional regulator [Kallipyga gabonensis]
MADRLSSSGPIYIQLLDHFLIAIVQGTWPPGEKIPSVRQLALQFEVNPNTVQKSLSQLEDLGLAQSQRTAGRFVTTDEERIEEVRKKLALREVKTFAQTMVQLGVSPDRACQLTRDNWPGEDQVDPRLRLQEKE